MPVYLHTIWKIQTDNYTRGQKGRLNNIFIHVSTYLDYCHLWSALHTYLVIFLCTVLPIYLYIIHNYLPVYMPISQHTQAPAYTSAKRAMHSPIYLYMYVCVHHCTHSSLRLPIHPTDLCLCQSVNHYVCLLFFLPQRSFQYLIP